MPKSLEASVPRDEKYVYDFLYHDARRVASFLAQLGPYGHLTSLAHSKSIGEESRSKTDVRGKGGIPTVLNVDGGRADEAAKSAEESIQAAYDPIWVNALDLFDKLDAAGLISREITSAGFGQIVLVKGSLTLIDLKMVRGAWETPGVRKMVIKSEPETTPGMTSQQKAEAKRLHQQTAQIMVDLLPIMPHLVQASVRADSRHSVWAGLADEWLVTSAAEIVLRHGAVLQGEWHMLGILDAVPEDVSPLTVGPGLTVDMITALNAFGATGIGQMALALGPLVRTMMGRPAGHFGMTPILIFRQVLGADRGA